MVSPAAPMPTLSPARWRQVDSLLAEALDRPADERTAFLRHACGEDPALYHEVNALLESDEEAERVIGEFVSSFAAPLLDSMGGVLEGFDRSESEPVPTSVGPYRIVREVGRGGMG